MAKKHHESLLFDQFARLRFFTSLTVNGGPKGKAQYLQQQMLCRQFDQFDVATAIKESTNSGEKAREIGHFGSSDIYYFHAIDYISRSIILTYLHGRKMYLQPFSRFWSTVLWPSSKVIYTVCLCVLYVGLSRASSIAGFKGAAHQTHRPKFFWSNLAMDTFASRGSFLLLSIFFASLSNGLGAECLFGPLVRLCFLIAARLLFS